MVETCVNAVGCLAIGVLGLGYAAGAVVAGAYVVHLFNLTADCALRGDEMSCVRGVMSMCPEYGLVDLAIEAVWRFR